MEQTIQATTSKYREFANQMHLEIHVLRRLPNYRPTEFEFKAGKSIARIFKDECEECSERHAELQAAKKPAKKEDSFLNKLGEAVNYVP